MNNQRCLLNKILVIGLLSIFIVTIIVPEILAVDYPIEFVNDSKNNDNEGNYIYVGGIGPGNYSTIQEAINEASDGSTIFVFDDSSPYYENIIIDKSINLIGEDKLTTIINARNLSHAIIIKHNWVNISGFTVTNASGIYSLVGIYIYKSNNHIISNTIIEYCKVGIRLEETNNNTICRNFIRSNYWQGMDIEDSSCDNKISNNIIKKNGASGINIDHYCNNNNIFNNTISYNRNSGIAIKFSKNNKIQKNNFLYNKRRVFFAKLIGESNLWDQNYWNRPRLFPKIISGSIYFDLGRPPISYSWINIDWRPATKPYIIEGLYEKKL